MSQRPRANSLRELGRLALRALRQAPIRETQVRTEPAWISVLPMIPILLWWPLGFILYSVGFPVDYTRINVGGVAMLVLSTTLLTTLVFFTVTRHRSFEVRDTTNSRWSHRLLLLGGVASVALLIPWAETYSGYHIWELPSAIANQGEAYILAQLRIADGTGSRLLVLGAQTLLAPLTMLVIPASAAAWFERRESALPLLLGLASAVSMSLLVGRDYFLVLAVVLAAAGWVVARARRRASLTWRFSALAGLGAIAFLVVFGLRKLSRADAGFTVCFPGAERCSEIDTPDLFSAIAVNFGSYSSQSLEGLGRALEGVWRFGGGYRHSSALSGIAETLFGPAPVTVITDQLEERDWSATAYWSTGLAQLANDIPWILVPVAVALFVGSLAVTWRRAVRDGDILSVTVFGYSWFVLIFLMQNLQLATNGPLYLGYIALTAVFLVRELRRFGAARRTQVDVDPAQSAPSE